jgi:hypothetical protein
MLNSLALGMVLSSINAQLPQLRTLSLTSKCSWTGADAVWSQLGQATQLTKLGFKFDKAIELGAHIKDLAPLSSLTGLQCLAFRLGKMAAMTQGLDFSQGFSVRLYASTLYAVRCTQYAARPVQYVPTVRCCTLCVPFSSVAAAGMCAGSGLALSGSHVR